MATAFEILAEQSPWLALAVAAGIGLIKGAWTVAESWLESRRVDRAVDLEERRHAHESRLQTARFDYEKEKWREDLSLEVARRHLEVRIDETPKLWSLVRGVAYHLTSNESLEVEHTKAIAKEVEAWRYSRGGLVAEEETRDVALAFQTVLWDNSGTKADYKKIRQVRRLLVRCLRADLGLGRTADGEDIYGRVEARFGLKERLSKLQDELKLPRESD